MLKRGSLIKKIQLLIIIIMLGVFGISQIVIIQYVDRLIYRQFETNTTDISKLLQKNIESYFKNVTNALDFFVEKLEGKKVNEATIRNIFKYSLETQDIVINTFVAFDDGSSILEPNVKLPPNFDPRERTWYKVAYGSSGVKWSEPYVDMATKELVVTGSMFVTMDGISGVMGMDILLENLFELVNIGRFSDENTMMLVNSNNDIIIDSEKKYLSKNLKDLGDEMLTKSNLITGYLRTEKGLYLFRNLRYTDIRLVSFLSNKELNKYSRQVQIILSLILIVALIIGIIIAHFIIRRLIKPLKKLTDTMQASTNQGGLLLYEGAADDEIYTLIEGYNNMATSFNEQQKVLRKATKKLSESEQKLQEQYSHAAKLAYTDYLTSLPNRVMFKQKTNEYIVMNEPFALCFIDLDNFKHINDTYGHSYGDDVLLVISQRFQTCCKGKFFASRLSGDEFGIIVTLNEFDITEIAQKLLATVEKSIEVEKLEFSVTASIGISLFPGDGLDYTDLLANADIAMYEAKKKNKNQFQFYQPMLKESLISRINLEKRLNQSILNDELEVYYQPLIEVKSGRVHGFEALLRWFPKDIEPVFPEVFIPIAEHNFFINEMGQYVLEQSLLFAQEVSELFDQTFEININVSPIQLHQEAFVSNVLNAIIESGVRPDQVNLEITESVALEDDKLSQHKLEVLRNHGLSISLDDFGTGYSSISHVLKLSLTHMKIDRSIMLEATKKDEVFQLVAGLVEFAHTINLQVVAEGIEDSYMESLVTRLGIDYFQGYVYSKPLPKDEIIALIKHELGR